MNKLFSAACENNKAPILAVLQNELASAKSVLEIGSGTGQHAAFFASNLSHLVWQASDVEDNLPSVRAWLDELNNDDTPAPLTLDVTQNQWPNKRFDAVFSANTAHIMAWETVLEMMAGVGQVLVPGGKFCLYGPFNYQGTFTSDSNRDFHHYLQDRDSRMGIRDFEDVVNAAEQQSLLFSSDNEMPANNRLLVFVKQDR